MASRLPTVANDPTAGWSRRRPPPRRLPVGDSGSSAGLATTRLVVVILALRMVTSAPWTCCSCCLLSRSSHIGAPAPSLLNAALGLGMIVGGALTFSLVGRQRLAPVLAVAAAPLGRPRLAVVGRSPRSGRGAARRGRRDRPRRLRCPRTDHPAAGDARSDARPRLRGARGARPGRPRPRVDPRLPVIVAVVGDRAGPRRGRTAAAGRGRPVLVWACGRWTARPSCRPGRSTCSGRSRSSRHCRHRSSRASARRTRWMTFEPGEVVIREGDIGDALLRPRIGRATSVTRGRPAPRDRRGARRGVGEIALLRDVPRTATVTAVRPSVLLMVGRADFLEVVTGSSPGARGGAPGRGRTLAARTARLGRRAIRRPRPAPRCRPARSRSSRRASVAPSVVHAGDRRRGRTRPPASATQSG